MSLIMEMVNVTVAQNFTTQIALLVVYRLVILAVLDMSLPILDVYLVRAKNIIQTVQPVTKMDAFLACLVVSIILKIAHAKSVQNSFTPIAQAAVCQPVLLAALDMSLPILDVYLAPAIHIIQTVQVVIKVDARPVRVDMPTTVKLVPVKSVQRFTAKVVTPVT